jgi:hypothetical protein
MVLYDTQPKALSPADPFNRLAFRAAGVDSDRQRFPVILQHIASYHATLLHTFFTTSRISRLTSEGGVDIAESGAPNTGLNTGRQKSVCSH